VKASATSSLSAHFVLGAVIVLEIQSIPNVLDSVTNLWSLTPPFKRTIKASCTVLFLNILSRYEMPSFWTCLDPTISEISEEIPSVTHRLKESKFSIGFSYEFTTSEA
jgi:hypothetical protein